MPHAARPTVTLHDVAAAAGVSVSTESRVLGGSTRKVAPEFEARVLAAAAALRRSASRWRRRARVSGSCWRVADRPRKHPHPGVSAPVTAHAGPGGGPR
ncbi:LacI family DNA-binding transcriptional regulator [Nonomuraea helvata]|uniref:LacI family DNA-binding transcriptional regulator n=1 Tax=Nonomuraea helvata TaxID=37484 RepID=A0ABV5SDC8_9ACTN